MVVAIILAALVLSRRYKKVGPDQAMVVFGRDRFRVVTGGAMFIAPIVQSVRYMDIGAKSLRFTVGPVKTKSGRSLDIGLVAVVKFSSEQPKLDRAVEQWLSRSVKEMTEAAQDALTTHVRAAVATVEAENVDAERDALSAMVRERVGHDFDAMGMDVVALLFRDITDHAGPSDDRHETRQATGPREVDPSTEGD